MNATVEPTGIFNAALPADIADLWRVFCAGKTAAYTQTAFLRNPEGTPETRTAWALGWLQGISELRKLGRIGRASEGQTTTTNKG